MGILKKKPGWHHSEEARRKMSKTRKDKFGEKSPNWKGGKIKKYCIVCEKEFSIYPYNTKRVFCSKSCKNRKINNGFKKGHKINVGKKCSEETKRKISIKHKGKKLSKEHIEKMKKIIRKSGWHHTQDTRTRISNAHKERVIKGLHNTYKGGVTSINKIIRRSLEFKLWREAVFKRDNWTCIFCKKHGYELHPDHIKPFALYPELRFAIDNGRTLCADCHRKTETWGMNKKYQNKTLKTKQLF